VRIKKILSAMLSTESPNVSQPFISYLTILSSSWSAIKSHYCVVFYLVSFAFSRLQYPQLKTIFHLLAFLFPPRFPLGLRFCLSISFLRLLVSNSCQHLIPLLASNSISALNLSVIGKLKKFNRLTGLLGLTNLSLI
jgi:hypothetical protein